MTPPRGVDEDRYYDDSLIPNLVSIDEHRILVIDHAYGNIHESFVRVFDTRTREWSNEDEEWPSLNQPRLEFSSVMCNGKVYVIGGTNTEAEYLNSIECLDLSASPRRWITLDQRLATARAILPVRSDWHASLHSRWRRRGRWQSRVCRNTQH